MKDPQARKDVERIDGNIKLFDNWANNHANPQIDRLQHAVADLQTKLNLLLGFLNAETFVVPEKPPIPAVPSHLDIRKVKTAKP